MTYPGQLLAFEQKEKGFYLNDIHKNVKRALGLNKTFNHFTTKLSFVHASKKKSTLSEQWQPSPTLNS